MEQSDHVSQRAHFFVMQRIQVSFEQIATISDIN